MASTIDDSDDLLERLEAEARGRGLSTEEYVLKILRDRHKADRLSEVVVDLREQLSDREDRIEELEAERDQYEQVETDLRETVSELRDRLESRAQRVEDLEAEVDERKQQTEALRGDVSRLQDRLDSRESRIEELEAQLARRSQVEEKVEELSMEVREEQHLINAPFPVRWWKWLRR
jgi:chromosome segregation protein